MTFVNQLENSWNKLRKS